MNAQTPPVTKGLALSFAPGPTYVNAKMVGPVKIATSTSMNATFSPAPMAPAPKGYPVNSAVRVPRAGQGSCVTKRLQNATANLVPTGFVLRETLGILRVIAKRGGRPNVATSTLMNVRLTHVSKAIAQKSLQEDFGVSVAKDGKDFFVIIKSCLPIHGRSRRISFPTEYLC